MHTITSTTTRRDMLVFASEPVTGTHLLEAAYGGKVRFAKVRESGTLRAWPVLAPNTPERKRAERLAGSGKPVAELAKAENVSVATLRRTLVSLAFTLELEGMKAKELAALAKAANENTKELPKAEPKPEPKPEAKQEAPKEPAKPARKPAPRKPAVSKQADKKAHAAKMQEEAASTVAAAKAAKQS